MLVSSIALSLSLLAVPVVRPGALLCGQQDTESEASYILENNLWGEAAGTGSQCSHATSASDSTVAWTTSYTWSGGPAKVKSYANLDLQVGLKKQICQVTSIPSVWKWSYTSASSNLVADVSYDLWLSTSATGTGSSSTSSYEIMVWLSDRGGAFPAGSQIGNAVVNGLTWKLFRGTVSTWTVYTFIAPSELTNYSEDMLGFITYLTKNEGISTSQYLVQLQAGTEPFVGTAVLTTSSYSTTVNSAASCGAAPSSPSTNTPSTTPTTSANKSTVSTTTSTTKVSTTSASVKSSTVSHNAQCGGEGYTGPTVCASPYTCQVQNTYYSQCS